MTDSQALESTAPWNKRAANWTIGVIAVITSAFFLYTAFRGLFPALMQRSFLALSALSIIYLQYFGKRDLATLKGKLYAVVDALFVTGSIVGCGYLFLQWRAVALREGAPIFIEYILGAVVLVAIFEACRRVFGWTLPLLGVAFIAYAYAGPYLPSLFSHRGLNTTYLLGASYLTTQGFWGSSTAAVANVVIFFIIFTSFLTNTRASDFFIDISQAIIGRVRGGPAKMAVLASSFMGMMSGSAVANVVSTGSVTIPLMKRVGYSPRFAGAVEAVASSGGQIMPPIMGAAAFLMADILGVSYWSVAIAALLPAIVYYATAYFIVHLEAVKQGLRGLNADEVPKFWDTMKKGGHLLIPILVLVVLIALQYSPMRSAIIAAVTLIVVSMFRSYTRINVKRFFTALRDAAVDIAPITVSVLVADFIIGIIDLTGLGFQMSIILTDLSGGSLVVLLLLTAVASLILGLGLPTVACYILLALTVCPTLIQVGIHPMAAHMFVLYYGILSAITPPIALASFAAAGIAGADPVKTSVTSMRLGIAAFLMPFIFVYEPALLLQEGWANAVFPLILMLLAMYAFSVATTGYFLFSLNAVRRLVYLAASILMAVPVTMVQIAGVALFAAMAVTDWVQRRAGKWTLNTPKNSV